jgi:hypothetical protein
MASVCLFGINECRDGSSLCANRVIEIKMKGNCKVAVNHWLKRWALGGSNGGRGFQLSVIDY